MKYQIESRWPSWAKWRKVKARPHDERMPFNERHEIEFLTETEAVHAIAAMSKANDGEYRIVEKNVCGVMCDCGSRDTVYTGSGGFQEADASRNMPMIDGDEVACNACGRAFLY